LGFVSVHESMAESSEQSGSTSIKDRNAPQFNLVEAIYRQTEQQAMNEFALILKALLSFKGIIQNEFQHSILLSFEDYLELVGCAGLISRGGRRGAVSKDPLMR
jgi:hypothetical protein